MTKYRDKYVDRQIIDKSIIDIEKKIILIDRQKGMQIYRQINRYKKSAIEI